MNFNKKVKEIPSIPGNVLKDSISLVHRNETETSDLAVGNEGIEEHFTIYDIKLEDNIELKSEVVSNEYEKTENEENSGQPFYSCNLCNYSCKSGSDVRNHTISCPLTASVSNTKLIKGTFVEVDQRGGFIHSCDECEYSSTNPNYLKIHKRARHEEIRYSCDECEFAATLKSNLQIHKNEQHNLS